MLWLTKFRKRKIQSILIFIVVMMCSILISGSAVIMSSLNSAYESLAEETNAPDLKIYPEMYQSAEAIQQLEQRIKECSKTASYDVIYRYSINSITKENNTEDVFVDVCAYNDKVYGQVRVIEGDKNQLSDDTCMLPAVTAKSLGAAVGDTIWIKMDNKEYSYKVCAIYAEIFSAASQYTCDLVIKDFPTGIETTCVYPVWYTDDVTDDAFIQEYTKSNQGILDGYFRSSSGCVLNAELTELILGAILLGISSMVFIAILFILSYIIKNGLQNDRDSIAVYKTIGYSNARVRRIYILFYMSMITAGAVLGGCLSPILSNAFISDVYQNVGETSPMSGIGKIVLCVVVICLIAFVQLLLGTRKITRMKPVEILSGSDSSRGKHKERKQRHGKIGFAPLTMATRMMRREKKNTILLIITCVISLYIVNLSVVCLQNLDLIKGEMNYYWLGIDKHDVTIENNGDIEEFQNLCEKIRQDDRVEGLIRRTYDMGFAIPYHQTTSALVYETFDGMESKVLEGRNPQHAEEVVIGNGYKKQLGVEIGDYLTVQLDATHRKDLLIVGTFQGFYNMGTAIKIRGDLLEENEIPFQYDSCSVTLKDSADKAAFMSDMKELYGSDIKVIDRLNLYSSIMDTICEPQKAALLPFAVIVILIGFLNAFYIIYASNVEKRKTYMIYKSLGYSARHLLVTNCLYIGVVAVISIAIAVPAFIFLFPKVMVLSMSMFGFAEYKLVINPIVMMITNLSMLLVFLLASCLAATDIYKNHIAKIMCE